MTFTLAQLVQNNQRIKDTWPKAQPFPAAAAAKGPNQADLACKGILLFRFLEGFQIQVGRRDIDWTGKHYKHQEWRAQLNRFFQLPALAKAWHETGDEDYARAARDYLEDWMDFHGPFDDQWKISEHDNTLNLSIRMGSSQAPGWLGTLSELHESPVIDQALLDRVVQAVTVQLNYLMHHLTIAANWRIAQADALLATGLRLAPLPQARPWVELGAALINEAARNQVLPDGAHIERNPSYHDWMRRVFTRYLFMSEAMPELGLKIDPKMIARMFEYSLGTHQPNGAYNGMHDCHGQHTGKLDDPIPAERELFLKKYNLPTAMPDPQQVFPDARQVFLRTDWSENAQYLTFDGTSWGGAHCHLSRNSISLFAHGLAMLPDIGSLTYEISDPMMPHCKSTRAHNTCNYNGWNQTTSELSRFDYAVHPSMSVVSTRYDGGYWSGPYFWNLSQGSGEGIMAFHDRSMIHLPGRYTVVIDNLYRFPKRVPEPPEASPFVECNWQLCEDTTRLDLAEDRAIAGWGDAGLMLLFAKYPQGSKLLHFKGESDPPRGWVDGGRKEYVPASQLSLKYEGGQTIHADIITLLMPFTGQDPPQVRVEHEVTHPNLADAMTLHWPDGSRDRFDWTYRLLFALEMQGNEYITGPLLYSRFDSAGRLTEKMMYDRKAITVMA